MFVVLEGIDGCGKSTVAEALKARVDDTIIVHAPTDSALDRAYNEGTAASSLFIMLEDIIHLLQKTIIPALKEGKNIILDRFWPSTVVYQTQQINEFLCMPYTDIMELCATAIGIALMESFAGDSKELEQVYYSNPMQIFFLDTEPGVALARLQQRNSMDTFESVDPSVITERRDLYLKLQKNKNVYHVLTTANKTVEDIADEILSVVR